MIMDYMCGNRLDSPLEQAKRLWPAEWNDYLLRASTSVEPVLVAHSTEHGPVVSCKGQSGQACHPLVYFKVYPGKTSTCPYCNLKFYSEPAQNGDGYGS